MAFRSGDDGLFWMPFESFAKIFNKLTILCKTMAEVPRSVIKHAHAQVISEQKAHFAKELIGVALSRLANEELLDDFRKLSVRPYDPYLNIPPWIESDRALRKQWINDKGREL